MPPRVTLGRPGFISRLPKVFIALSVAILATQFPALADTTAWQTNGWQVKAPIGTPSGSAESLEGHCSSLIGNKIYTAFGFHPGPGDTNSLRIYDINTDSWSPGPPATDATLGRAEGYRGIAHGGKLWCVGGRQGGEGGSIDPRIFSFDPATGVWQTSPPLAPMGTPLAGTTAVTFANNIFVFGGRTSAHGPCTGGESDAIQRYDIPSNTWSSAGTLPSARSDSTAARVGRYVYIFGGCTSGGSIDDVIRYDPKTGTAITLCSFCMPGGARNNASAADPQNGSSANASHLIHVTGGFDRNTSADPSTNHIVWDVDQQAFTTAPGNQMPTNCGGGVGRGEFELLYGGDRIFAVGGSCPALGDAEANVDMQVLSKPITASASTVAYAADNVPNASMVAYSCGPNTFPVCATEPLGVSVVLITGTGFAPLSTVSLSSSSLGGLPVAVADVQGEFLTTFVDTCNAIPQSVSGTDSLGNTSSVSFSCPE